MTRMDQRHKAFNELVAMKYQLYNGLFLGLPFEDLADTGVQLPLFANACREKLQAGKSPAEIVEQFFRERPGKIGFEAKVKILFKFLQLVERQVVLFDALEDAAFSAVNDLEGPGSLSHFLSRVQDHRKKELLESELADYRIRIVLTAHPTQFYPDSILGIITDLSEAIEGDKLPAINDLLLQMGKTRFQNRQRPTPLEEARSLIWYLEHIFYGTLPAISDRLVSSLTEERQDPFLHQPKVELGFWPGGDRDGNPFVTSETTLRVAQELKASVLKLYLQDMETLLGRLTFDGIIQPLQAIRDRLQDTLALFTDPRGNHGYAGPEELLRDLKPLRRELAEGHQGLFMDRLDGFIYKVQTFGFHFAALDLRQDSRIHAAALEEIFSRLAERGSFAAAKAQRKGSWPRGGRFSAAEGAGTSGDPKEAASKDGGRESAELLAEMRLYAGLSAEGKVAFLEKCLRAPEIKAEFAEGDLDPLALDTLSSLAAARSIQKSNGERSLSRYIISQANSVLNVLEAMVLARLSGWKAGQIRLDVVPLFETIDDLKHAESIMRRLYALPGYAEHLALRGNSQTIMLGFSDGTKDGGYITANWAIHKAKRDLTRVSREAGVRAIFFDGRGGPPARGGGNTHKFYRSLGADIEHGEIQITIQGQTISSNFGTPEAARFNVEQLLTAGLEDKLFPPEVPDLLPEDIRLLDRLSEHSRDAYKRFREDPLFLPYLEEMTPLSYYNLLNIASRPTRRKSSSLRFEDLRAIPFVGAWSQMKQNIPGFYGVAVGLSKLIASRSPNGGRRRLEELYRSSLFFRTLVENAMMSLSKSYFPLTRYLEKDRKYGKFWRRIYKEATESKRLLKEITGQQKLMESNLAMRESIHMRERIILPLLVIQQYAMAMVRAAHKNPDGYPKGAIEAYGKMVVKSMAANINAARNSA
ncbi:MAG: Phosphoenolpyruvate carboxylase [Fibrobacteres bacterium]|nr:Phosphoenolpyruvate carboxylase [Fibrobacterota bacterium]